MKHQVEGHKNVYKDPKTGVLVNRSDDERNRYRIAKRQAVQSIEASQDISQLKRDVKELSELKGEIDELKQMIQMLLNK